MVEDLKPEAVADLVGRSPVFEPAAPVHELRLGGRDAEGECREDKVGANCGWAGDRGGFREMSRCDGFRLDIV